MDYFFHLISTPNYYIYQNGTSVKNGSWVNATDIGFNIDGLAAGSYNYSIFVTDGFGIILQDDVIVTVLQLEVPQFTHPSDLDFYRRHFSPFHRMGCYLSDG